MNRAEYTERCGRRWHNWAWAEASENWFDFEEMRPVLEEAMREFKHNPSQLDLSGKYHNRITRSPLSFGSLTPRCNHDTSYLTPLLDFEEYFQKVFLRRGLVIYCTMLLEESEKGHALPEGQLELI